ncbi:MAG: penicillin-binding protein 2 [Patescibacteria group bacterium]
MVPRLAVVIVAFGLGYVALVSHLYDLQLIKGPGYLVRAESQYAAANLLKAERGVIYFTDKNGKHLPAVSNKNFPLIYAVPKVIEDPSETAYQLASILNQPPENLLPLLSNRTNTYKPLLKKAEAQIVKQVDEMAAKGIYVGSVVERFYPFGKLVAHLLGFVAPNDEDFGESGRYGVEEVYDQQLAGIAGEIKGNKIMPPRSGRDLILTIDPNIQIEAERILQSLQDTYKTKGGSVIVMEPQSGKILAMGSLPNFDPNAYSESDIANFLNPVTQQIYEPGSVFKIITMAAGLDSGKITPDTTFYDTGKLELNKRTIKNWDLKAHGTVTMTNVLEKSINTGAAFAERQTGDEIFKNYLVKFGFGEKTGVDLPGEIRGDLKRLTPQAPAIAFATASFGQGVAVTPLQLISAASAIANGGKLMRPYVNDELGPKEIREVISARAARQVTDMMVSALDKAEVAKISSYALAGKTGTAQVPIKGGYADDRVINTYVGFGPVTAPRFVILIKINEPEGAPVAGLTVVPAFRELAQFILNYYNIPPDRLDN